ncbi:MAG TPA: ROK family protein [Candidatus Acidoferrales bacterium]|jgi:glucokinase|nr:ROK family protein [Candidatus Acidoferrales bacterium]
MSDPIHVERANMPQGSNQDGFVIGVDIGGTKIAVGLVDQAGEIQSQARAYMVSNAGAAAGLAAVNSVIDCLSRQSTHDSQIPLVIRSIGICCPGPLDPDTGVVINPPNLPCWRNFPLAAEILHIYGVPVKMDNDANAAALAEALWGAGRGYRNVFYATLGTGIGTGIVFDGRIYHGRTGAAAEGGHMSIDYRGPRCSCGKPGCIEALASGPAIARRARARLRTTPGSGSLMLDLAGGNPDLVTSEMVGQAYAAGDLIARDLLRETIELLSLWLGNIVDLLEPDVMIMGGGVGCMLKPLLGELRDHLLGCCVNSRCQEIPLLSARYGTDAGVIGGAALCYQTPGRDGVRLAAPSAISL